MLLVADGPRWARPMHGYPSTHILKVDDRVRRGLVRAEHACLTLARRAGIAAAESTLITVGDAEAIIVTRFDRHTAANGAIARIHQEDTCQALGIDPEKNNRRGKYEAFGGPTLVSIASLLDRWATDGPAQLDALLAHLVFTVAICNADAHGKNLALLHRSPGHIELAPLYDTVPTVLWSSLRTNAAMTVNGKAGLPQIALDDLAAEAASWSLDPQAARARATELCERLLSVLETDAIDIDTPALVVVADRLRALLASPATS
jgi:serine/threonine-protein kinase HipA